MANPDLVYIAEPYRPRPSGGNRQAGEFQVPIVSTDPSEDR